MSESTRDHKLYGLEPDNLLAFLALLGLLRSLEASDHGSPNDPRLLPRAWWDLEAPLLPVLRLAEPMSRAEVTRRAADGLAMLAQCHDFSGQKDLNYLSSDARTLLEEASATASSTDSRRADVITALMSDAALKEGTNQTKREIDPTPLCLLFGQGHQHFLQRLSDVPRLAAPPPKGKGKSAAAISSEDCLSEALFSVWHRSDRTFSFRWDPEEDARYALLPGDPTDAAYKAGTQHGANRLAAIGVAALPVAPRARAGRVRPAIPGGMPSAAGFSFRWPIWRQPASLSAIQAMLSHPKLEKEDVRKSLDIAYVLTAKRISVGKFMNFTRAR